MDREMHSLRYWFGVGMLFLIVSLSTHGNNAFPAKAQSGGITTRLSVGANGESNGISVSSTLSANGNSIAFTSEANNLVENDSNSARDVFVVDRLAGQLCLISIASDGTLGNYGAGDSSISADGRFIAFSSTSTNLIKNDTNDQSDIFVHDRQSHQTTRVSVASDGSQSNNHSYYPVISADGRYVAFSSDATNLVANDTNSESDIFVYDRQTGQTTRVSVATDGTQGNDESWVPSISADGRYVAFPSNANNLVSDDTNNTDDIFVHDRQRGETTRISVTSDGTESNNRSYLPSISGDGQVVTFASGATNLVSDDTNGADDIFVHDLQTGQTTRVSVATDGTQSHAFSENPVISLDGRYVSFTSIAGNLVSNDTNGVPDIFVHDRQTGETSRVSVATNGSQSEGGSNRATISADGNYIAFDSIASNLVATDTNALPDVFLRDRGDPSSATPVATLTPTATSTPTAPSPTGDSALFIPVVMQDHRFLEDADPPIPMYCVSVR